MKKIICAAFAVIIMLSSCAPTETDKNSFFDYQQKKMQITGLWKTQDVEYGIILKIGEETENGRNAELEFISPETLKGIKFLYNNTFLSASLGEMAIDLENRNPEAVFRIIKLLSLKPEDISEIDLKGETTVAKGQNETEKWTVVTNKAGHPKKITYFDENSESVLTIEDFQIIQ